MAKNTTPTRITLPKDWPEFVRSAIIHVISLAGVVISNARGLAAQGTRGRNQDKIRIDTLEHENGLLKEELRIKDVRTSMIDPLKRPHYRPQDRLAILELKAMRGWTAAETARRFLLRPRTISSWLKRIDEKGKDALVRVDVPVNKFPEFVRYIVRRLKLLCPSLGRKKIAQFLARAGLKLSESTVRRILNEKKKRSRPSAAKVDSPERENRAVISRYSNHTWNVDITIVPTRAGFWVPWLPFTNVQEWPFCWHLACVIDHFSRRILGYAVYHQVPTSVQLRSFLGRIIRTVGGIPKYIISDKGGQFWSNGFKKWCNKKGIVSRYGTVGEIGSIAVLERFFKSAKGEWLRRTWIPYRRKDMHRRMQFYIDWYNQYRPHESLQGCTPKEIYENLEPAHELNRFEPRQRDHRKRRLCLQVTFYGRSRYLPVVEIKQAA